MSAINTSLLEMKLDAERTANISSNSLKFINKNISEGKKKLQDIALARDFFSCIAFMNAQTKSPKIDRFIHLKLNHEYIKSSLGRGDGYSRAEDKYYEYKISTTNKDKNINALQIRIWQAVDFYILGYVDEEVFENSRLFKLSHEEMKNECVKFGLSATHGTREANLNNKNIELTFRLKMDFSNKEYLRFEKLYRDNDLEDKVFDGFR